MVKPPLTSENAGNNPQEHELQVRRIEQELQNEAWREALIADELALESYSDSFDFAPIAYFNLDRRGAVQRTNFRAAELWGCDRSGISGQYFGQRVSPEDQPVFDRFLRQVFSSEATLHCELTLQLSDRNCSVAVAANADKNRQTCRMAVFDISKRKQAEQELELAATVYSALSYAIMIADVDNRIIDVNPAFSRVTGYTAEEAIGKSPALLKSGRHDKFFYMDMWETVNSSGHWAGEIWNRRKNGEIYIEWLSIDTVYDDRDEAIRRIGIFSDITERKQAESIIRKQANIDPLTELPNRRLFLERLQRAVNKSSRSHSKLGLMFLDLDNFKDVNDTLGHDLGDHLLIEVARRLKTCIRESDTLARTGGDEFVLIIGDLEDIGCIDRIAENMLEAMTRPFQLKSEQCYISISIGITVYPNDSADMENLLKKADHAMYAAKQQGRNRYCYFTPIMQEAANNRLRLTNDLRRALAGRQFWIAFQPIVDLATGQIRKAEALIRWRHPTLGLVAPSEFIPIAEDTGMIVEIGEWVFQQAAAQVKKWRALYCPNFQVSVNKSPIQFRNNASSQHRLFEHLQDLGLPGESIIVEITEGLLLDASPIVSEKLFAYRDAGMQVSLDDFGTGYSSLAYLKRFDIDYLKIDRAFVANMTEDSTDLVVCEAMIAMAHKLGMKVIAEGIETLEQRELLIKAGCDFGQGYFYSKPLPAEEFDCLLHGKYK
jgi:diguanylate cyclase (GGDEF)-like protein/PAS domain S-box-containing protein